MANETLKELQYNGQKIVVEVARRDALGRTIDTQINELKTSVSGKQDKITSSNKLSYNLLSDTPTIDKLIDDAIEKNPNWKITNDQYIAMSEWFVRGNGEFAGEDLGETLENIINHFSNFVEKNALGTYATKTGIDSAISSSASATKAETLNAIPAWAKASSKPEYRTNEIKMFNPSSEDKLCFLQAYPMYNGTNLDYTLKNIVDGIMLELDHKADNSDLQNYVTKTSFNSLNGTVTTIGNAVSKLGPQVTELDTKVSNLEKYRNPVWFKSNYVPLGAVSVDMTFTFEPESYSTLALSGGAMMNPNHANGNGIYAKEGDLIIFPRCACLAIGRVYGFSNSRIQVAIVVAQFFSNTCLEQGTLITMYDGTEKPIEEIKDGDILLSYDFEKQQHCPAVCLVNTQTITNTVTDYLTFSNDTIIGVDVTASHEIYDATKGCFVSCKNELPIGDKVLDIDGNEVEFLGPVDWNSDGNTKGFYNIISSNNCYYANGILMAHHPYCKKSWTQRYRNIPLSDELNNILELDSIDMSKNSYQVRDVNVIKKMNKLRGQLIRSKVEMGNLIDNLTDTDYISQKASEGYKSEKITKILADREAWRADYNAREIKHKALQQEYDSLIASNSPLGKNALLSEMELRAKLFKEACKRDNENYALFLQYFRI